jgi:hypothetical protein
MIRSELVEILSRKPTYKVLTLVGTYKVGTWVPLQVKAYIRLLEKQITFYGDEETGVDIDWYESKSQTPFPGNVIFLKNVG